MANQAQVITQALEVVEATTTNLCHNAYYIAMNYGCYPRDCDVFECIDRMTDADWCNYTKQPAFVRPIYVKLSQKGDGWRELVQLAFQLAFAEFCNRGRKQAKPVKTV